MKIEVLKGDKAQEAIKSLIQKSIRKLRSGQRKSIY